MKCQLLHKIRIFSAVILLALIVNSSGTLSSAIAEDSVSSKSDAVKDKQVFMGRWIRPDGGYVLEFHEGQTEGRLNAAYYNPKPINVARAEFTLDNDIFSIFVELRDFNYPGSSYRLNYDPKTDCLIGTYFQAVDKITYNVMFIRDE